MYNFRSYIPLFIKNNNPIKYLCNKYYWSVFMEKSPQLVKLFSTGITNESINIELYIVAFNNDRLIKNQIEFLRKNCLDNYKLIIADNSTNKEVSKKIYELCKNNHIDYIKLPKNDKIQLSRSHWYSLNYLMKNFILTSEIPYFGLLDHDCFLIKKTSFVEKLKKQKVYGALIDSDFLSFWKFKINYLWNRWIVWPWCAFYDKSIFKKWYDFTPSKRYIPLSFLDTWGWNWKYIYKYYNKDELQLPHKIHVKKFEYIWDEFFHIYWAWYRKDEIISEWLKELEGYR